MFRRRRSRRALVWGSIAVLCGLYVMDVARRIKSEPATCWIPTTIIALEAPLIDDDLRHPFDQALIARWGRLWNWQEAIVAKRQIEAVAPEEIFKALRYRIKWVAGLPQKVELKYIGITPLAAVLSLQVESTDDRGVDLHAFQDSFDWRPFHSSTRGRTPTWLDRPEARNSVMISPLPAGRHTFNLRFTLSGPFGARKIIERPMVINAYPSIHEAIEPVSVPTLDAVVKSAVKMEISLYKHSQLFHLLLDPQKLWIALYQKTYRMGGASWRVGSTVAARLDILNGHDVLYSAKCWKSGEESAQGNPQKLIDFAFDQTTRRWDRAKLNTLVVRVTADPESAILDYYRSSYWQGQFTLPLSDVLEIQSSR